MKLLISIGLNLWLLLVFTAAPNTYALACGGKSPKNEVKNKVFCQKEGQKTWQRESQKTCQNENKKNCQKEGQKTCQKACCKKSKKTQKRCCGDDNCTGDCDKNGCTCASPNAFAAILIPTFDLNITSSIVAIQTQPIPFTKTAPKSVFIKFWQPPKL